MDRGSDKHSPMRDDQMKHDTEGLVRGGRGTHAEEWKDPEPSGEDQLDSDMAPEGTLHGGTPAGMSSEDLEGRAEIATYLGKAYPMVREQVIDAVIEHRAPDRVIDLVRRLPAGREFHNVNEIWAAVGGGVEGERY